MGKKLVKRAAKAKPVKKATQKSTSYQDRVRRAEALQKSLAEFQNAIEKSSIVSRADHAGNITYVNENFVKISGFSSAELIGQNHRVINSQYHPKSFWINMWKSISSGNVWRAEVKNKAKDGSYYWVDTFIMPFLDEKGRVREFLSIRNDITQRKAQEESITQLNQSLADFQDAIQYSSIVSRADKAGVITYVNENFINISGYSKQELIGQNHRIINSAYHPKEFWIKMWKTIAGGKIWREEVKNRAKNGSFYWVDTFIMPFLDEHGKVKEFLSIRNDITSRKQSEEALSVARQKAEKANQAKSEFLANMSHEIRTPLNAVIGFTDLIKKTDLNAVQSEYISTINQSAYSLLEIVNNVLDFSKIEAGKMELALEPVNLFTMGKQVVELVRHLAEQKQIKLIYTCEDEPMLAMADGIRIKQVLMNLLSNAIKFTERGEIELKIEKVASEKRTQRSNDELNVFRFSVRDTGVGIHPASHRKIFEAFSQEDSSVTKKYGGTGLGLSISNKLLNIMNSQLALQSAPGAGSTFYFDLIFSCSVFSSPSAIREQQIKNGSPNLRDRGIDKLKILIAEDNPVNMSLTKNIVRNMLADVILFEAVNGKLAVELYHKEAPDIILMDVQMPEMNGYEATESIRNSERQANSKAIDRVVIVALTAGAIQGEREKCLSAGMDDFIAKPIVENALETILEKWISLRGKNASMSIISLERLDKMLGGRSHQVNEVLNVYLNSVSPSVVEIRQSVERKDWHDVKAKLHSIKSYFNYFGLDNFYKQINDWESSLLVDPTIVDHKNMVDHLEQVVEKTVLEIRQILHS